ncbi:MAG: UDP-N-acetylglucosamine 2-epimerase (non-hydrolyzing) [Candidatus Omnitrophica bacterium]|nr:UDP-N-acetylglucosamine 2-epimerase (non-hydrolyzing) [Candidatus Omnitrophota bacterium]
MEKKVAHKILIVLGTRPEAIKLAPVINAFQKHKDMFEVKVVISSQHKEMLKPFLDIFNIKPDFDLKVMRPNQTLDQVTSSILNKMGKIFNLVKPEYVIVQGDTTTALAVALSAFHNKVKVAHVEAGLRTNDKLQPYPEEINRQVIDRISDLFFAPTETAKLNLEKEKIDSDLIEMTGNTVIDAALNIADKNLPLQNKILNEVPFKTKKIILVTAHRRENLGKPLEQICEAVMALLKKYPDLGVVFPVHLNPHVQKTVKFYLSDLANVWLTAPLGYTDFIYCMKNSYCILSDSGGVQEEASCFHIPVLVMRDATERPEVIHAGAARLVGTSVKKIIIETELLLNDSSLYKKMTQAKNPYGNGHAADRIIKKFIEVFS